MRLGEPFTEDAALKARQAELVDLNTQLQTDEVAPPDICLEPDRVAASPGLGVRSS